MSSSIIDLRRDLYSGFPLKTTLELGAEEKIANAKTISCVLSALRDVDIKVEKRGLLKGKRVENYDEIIERLEKYAEQYGQVITPDRLYHALKDLEKSVEGELKEKIKALRKEVDRREGIGRKKAVGAALIAAFGLAALGGLYYQFVYKPEE
ncbi:MAG: hypothetical protein FGF53_06110 [Candidatus Brockarchaeota archaeon]|nr:hypothetical protein [Candidatus Brockarchaeota archaeon]